MTKDAILLDLLKRNARESVSELARKLGISRTTVKQRIDRLERTGAIAGYTIKLGESLRKHRIRAHTWLVVEPSQNTRIVSQIRKISAVETLYAVSGKIDFIAIIEVDTTDELDGCLDRISEIDGIHSMETAVVLTTKFDHGYAMGKAQDSL